MRALGTLVNALLRASIVGVLVEALARPDDHRFAGKAIGQRGLVMIPLSAFVPALHAGRRLRGEDAAYPVWTDNLWLSIFALDLAGNHFDWYDRHRHFDLIPHAHGTGAGGVAVAEVLRLPALSGLGLAQIGHVLLEAQEYYSDVWFGLRNVRGTWDTVSDLLAGVAGSVAYAAALGLVRRRRGARGRPGRAATTGTRPPNFRSAPAP
ncbi:MAG TPA: hypothetical protein VHK63_04190 [Candidatus Limnocylindria bacterium]|nr:hypothetical protein [Candidatus Limnocylindria bacterium]